MSFRFEVIPLSSITVPANRQREDKNVDDLLPSIRARGVISPIIVEKIGKKTVLIAGERRLICARQLKHDSIPARFLDELSLTERKIIELEENLHRRELPWKDFVKSVWEIHELHEKENPTWTHEQTGESINLSGASVSRILKVAHYVIAENKQILACPGWSPAYNIIARLDARRADNAFNELMEEPHEAEPTPDQTRPDDHAEAGLISPHTQAIKREPPNGESIINGDFCSWASGYSSSALFNFIHCDFPYGIGLDKSAQGNSARWGGYSDGASDYWTLCQALVDNFDKLFAPSAHLMFWLSSDFNVISSTVEFLSSRTDLHFNPKPLIWFKSDNRGILPDPKRGPRHVYETALFASRGDRLVNQSVSDCYAAHTGDKSHQSEKPEPMLRHFFKMFIGEGTRFLDPTCGTGSSVRAADSLGASCLGIELNPEWAEHGRELLKKSRILRHYEERSKA
jgi:ParB/RepB/Spo0J family partition protein